jgi:hypothetical protein
MIDIEKMHRNCYRLQWSADQIDWDSPGKDKVSAAQAESLEPFVADLYWIETVAAVVFAAMEKQTDDPTLKSIFASFAVDEERHAEAELGLMVRWGMVAQGMKPEPNLNVKLLLGTLQGHAGKIHPSVYAAIIPLTELVLDGALVKYLLEAVTDPLCHEVFAKINADEARHLAVDFFVLEKYGKERAPWLNAADFGLSMGRARSLYAFFLGYLPVLSRSKDNIVRAGLDLDRVKACLNRYVSLGAQNPDIARHPTYAVIRAYARQLASGNTSLGDALVRASDYLDHAAVALA